VTLPPFPVDPATLDMLTAAINPREHGDPDAPTSSVGRFLEVMSELGGSDIRAIGDVVNDGSDGGPVVQVMRDPQYHEHDLIEALVGEVRRLRRADPSLPEHLRGDGPCTDCGTADNIVWFTESVFWNAVCRQGDYVEPMLCIPCFVVRAHDAGYAPTGWRLLPDFHWETHTERQARRNQEAA
jgi:hypothetical protein